MHDHFNETYEWDDDGHLRKKRRVLPDGARENIPVTLMDAYAACGFRSQFADGSPDLSSPFRPGFRVLDTDNANRIAANDAYEERRQRQHYANRYRRKAEEAERRQDDTPAIRDAAHARELADAAYRAKCERQRNAWRNHRP